MKDFFGEPKDRNGAIALLRKAAELGVNFFDTADFYGPGVTNKLIADALYPYAADLLLLQRSEQNAEQTKVGFLTASPTSCE